MELTLINGNKALMEEILGQPLLVLQVPLITHLRFRKQPFIDVAFIQVLALVTAIR